MGAEYKNGKYKVDWEEVGSSALAGAVIAIIPVILMFDLHLKTLTNAIVVSLLIGATYGLAQQKTAAEYSNRSLWKEKALQEPQKSQKR